jgi:two-component system chemotaxis sensor kinase CheA
MSSNVATSAEFERFRATFFEECAEILPEFDERLSSLHVGEVDTETLNAIFRAVHSIKAGAAAFNFKALVEFAHIFEALLDRLRDNRIQQTEHVFNVIVRAGDVLAELVEAARAGPGVPEGFGADVASELQELLTGVQERPMAAPASVGRPERGPSEDAIKNYRIVFEPHRELFRHANEPLLIIRELKRLGELSIGCVSIVHFQSTHGCALCVCL